MDQLVLCLEKTVLPDQNELLMARTFLDEASQQNIAILLKSLSEILANVNCSAIVRTAAGIHLKNNLKSIHEQHHERWLSIDQATRTYITKKIIEALGTDIYRPSSAAYCAAAVAVAEIRVYQQCNLIQVLTNNVIDKRTRRAAIEAIGYICQDIRNDILMSGSENMFTAILFGMRNTEPNECVRLTATKALYNSLEFMNASLGDNVNINATMEVVCESTQNSNIHIVEAAMQCLVKISTLYYEHMEQYMARAIIPITVDAIKSKKDQIALQGIQLWLDICEKEIKLNTAQISGRLSSRNSKLYARGASRHLVPVLEGKLDTQRQYEDGNNWDVLKAANICLTLLSKCCAEEVIQLAIDPSANDIHEPTELDGSEEQRASKDEAQSLAEISRSEMQSFTQKSAHVITNLGNSDANNQPPGRFKMFQYLRRQNIKTLADEFQLTEEVPLKYIVPCDLADILIFPDLQRGFLREGVGANGVASIQQLAMANILMEQNVFFQAPIGSGKTTTMLIAMTAMVDRTVYQPQIIYFGPTMESVFQVENKLKAITKDTTITSTVVHFRQTLNTNFDAQIVLGTPLMLAKLIENGTLCNDTIKMLFFDDADLTIKFKNIKSKVIDKLPNANVIATASTKVDFEQNDLVELKVRRSQILHRDLVHYYMLANTIFMKIECVKDLVDYWKHGQIMVFCDTRKKAHDLYKILNDGIRSVSIITSETGNRRTALEDLIEEKVKIVITTNALYRAVDLPNISLIVNFNVPMNVDFPERFDRKVYQNRAGRTGRFGRHGAVVTLVDTDIDAFKRAMTHEVYVEVHLIS